MQQSRLIEELSVHEATLVYYFSCPEKLNIHWNFYFSIL